VDNEICRYSSRADGRLVPIYVSMVTEEAGLRPWSTP
jgi:hypothetical protein